MNKEIICPDCARDFWCESDYLNHRIEEHGYIKEIIKNLRGKGS